jgi:hypothetical protein
MTTSEKELWLRIEDFEIDDLESTFSFSDRLARENDWSLEYSLRAILEYKKFIFLVCISSHSLTPSDEIDQVWHLHLLYTQSYWIDLCENILNRQIHHDPTRGQEEQGKFKNQYQFTLDFYSDKFDKKPPKDIWPKSSKRFESIRFSRVNRHKYWLLPKINIFNK